MTSYFNRLDPDLVFSLNMGFKEFKFADSDILQIAWGISLSTIF